MHIDIICEGYRSHIDKWIKALEAKHYNSVNPLDGKPMIYTIAVRETRKFEVVFPRQIRDEVLADLGYNTTWGAHRNRTMFKIFNFFLRFFRPFGYRPITKGTSARQTVIPSNIHVFLVAEKDDRVYPKTGWEAI